MKIVILGLSITSSWGNGHATTYRGLVRELVRRDHDVLFLERDCPWYSANRDLPKPPFGRTEIYSSVSELRRRFAHEVAMADCVIVGSFVPNGNEIGGWIVQSTSGVTAFYDIDTPITLEKIAKDDCDYLSAELINSYDIYLSFTGGPTLALIESEYGSRMARPLYCSVDPALYFPEKRPKKWALGYLGTFSSDRQPTLNSLLLTPAAMWPGGRFVVAGPQYPRGIQWPNNVQRVVHLNPAEHRSFYNAQRFTLNVTRAAMVRAGYSPSVRLFEAAACGTPIISDAWPGLDTIFEPDEQILIARTPAEVLEILRELPEETAHEIGARARKRVLAEHTSAGRAAQLENYIEQAQRFARGEQELVTTGSRRDEVMV
ncbi:MAG: glycosyltransferase [Verrucomicrobia bacterium]|nr:MAG: glycosyltransferase [Verrucomicrobiota bacterium]